MVRFDGLLYDLLWRVPISLRTVNKVWLPLLLIYIWESMKCSMSRPEEVDILVLTFYTTLSSFLTAWNRLMFSVTDICHINWLPYQTPGISNQALHGFRERCENDHVKDGILAKKRCNFWQHPHQKMVRSENFRALKLSEELIFNFYNLG